MIRAIRAHRSGRRSGNPIRHSPERSLPGTVVRGHEQGAGSFVYNCSMRTLEQCVSEVIAGTRGFCNPNPYYRGPEAAPPRVKRKRYYYSRSQPADAGINAGTLGAGGGLQARSIQNNSGFPQGPADQPVPGSACSRTGHRSLGAMVGGEWRLRPSANGRR